MENYLAEREANFRLLLNSAAEGIFETDLKGTCTFCNSAALRMLGYSEKEEIRKISLWDLLRQVGMDGDEYLREDPKILQILSQNAKTHDDQQFFRTRDGNYFPVEYWAYPIFKEGIIAGSVITFLDISDRKRTELEMSRSESILANIIEGTNVGTWDWYIDSGVTVFNERWAEIVGYRLAELAPISIQTWIDLVHPDDLQKSGDLLKLAFSGEIPFYDLECRMKHKFNGWVWVHDRGKVIEWSADAKPIRMAGTHSDITLRKKHEADLAESEQLFHAIFEKSQAIKLLIDPHDLTIVDANTAAAGFYGYAIEHLKSMKISDINILPVVELSLKMGLAMAEKQLYFNFRHRLADGSIRDVEVYSSPILVNGKSILHSIVHDVTEKVQFEKALRSSESRLTELNATKDKFFSIIAHDLRSPFNAIISFSELLVGVAKSKEYGQVEEYATIIRNSSNRAMDLLTNLLEWARLQTGKLEMNVMPIDMVTLVQDSIRLANEASSAKLLTISERLPKNAYFMADKQMLSTVVRNLISNAIKFTNQGGEVMVSVARKGEQMETAVSDNGVGMSPLDVEKLFRIESSHSTAGTMNEKGTGLGLLLCKEFVQKHGGKIWVESVEGKGSVFTFSIPIL